MAGGVGLHAPRGARQCHRDLFTGIGAAPDVDRTVTLQNHVIRKRERSSMVLRYRRRESRPSPAHTTAHASRAAVRCNILSPYVRRANTQPPRRRSQGFSRGDFCPPVSPWCNRETMGASDCSSIEEGVRMKRGAQIGVHGRRRNDGPAVHSLRRRRRRLILLASSELVLFNPSSSSGGGSSPVAAAQSCECAGAQDRARGEVRRREFSDRRGHRARLHHQRHRLRAAHQALQQHHRRKRHEAGHALAERSGHVAAGGHA